MRILIVEDEPLVAFDIEVELTERGFEVVRPVGDVSSAIKLVEQEALSAAVLDINIRGGHSFDVARTLDKKRVPFVFISGDIGSLPDEFTGRPMLSKPIDFRKLDPTLRAVLSQESGD